MNFLVDQRSCTIKFFDNFDVSLCLLHKTVTEGQNLFFFWIFNYISSSWSSSVGAKNAVNSRWQCYNCSSSFLTSNPQASAPSPIPGSKKTTWRAKGYGRRLRNKHSSPCRHNRWFTRNTRQVVVKFHRGWNHLLWAYSDQSSSHWRSRNTNLADCTSLCMEGSYDYIYIYIHIQKIRLTSRLVTLICVNGRQHGTSLT